MIRFTIFGEPVAKGRPKFFKRGSFVGTFTPAKTKQAEYDFKVQSLQYKPQEPLQGAVVLTIKAYKGIPSSFSKKRLKMAILGEIRPITRPDWDNIGKLVSDSMNGIFFRDDSQVIDCRVEKYYSNAPRLEIEISEI